MADSWSDICRQCVSTVAEVPVYILLGSLLATSLGVFVLVSSSSLLPAGFLIATCANGGLAVLPAIEASPT